MFEFVDRVDADEIDILYAYNDLTTKNIFKEILLVRLIHDLDSDEVGEYLYDSRELFVENDCLLRKYYK